LRNYVQISQQGRWDKPRVFCNRCAHTTYLFKTPSCLLIVARGGSMNWFPFLRNDVHDEVDIYRFRCSKLDWRANCHKIQKWRDHTRQSRITYSDHATIQGANSVLFPASSHRIPHLVLLPTKYIRCHYPSSPLVDSSLCPLAARRSMPRCCNLDMSKTMSRRAGKGH
jgi:hypothetical protein